MSVHSAWADYMMHREMTNKGGSIIFDFDAATKQRSVTRKITGGVQRTKVVECKTRPNKTKLSQRVGMRLVDTSSKKGNIQISGGSTKCVLADRPGVYQ